MGARNVAAAMTLGRALPHPTKLVLVEMALVSLDDDKPPRYFAGWEPLAFALGKEIPDGGDAESERKRRNMRAEVNRHVRRLEDAGLIARAGGAYVGHNQEYALRLASVPPAKGSAERPTEGSAERPTEGSAERPTRGTREEQGEEERTPPAEAFPRVPAREAHQEKKHDRDEKALTRARAVLKPLTDVDTLMHRAREDLDEDADFAAIIIRAAELAKDAA